MNIIIVGPSPRDMGGIATVIRNILNYKNNFYSYTLHVARPNRNFLIKLLLVPFFTLFYFLRTTIHHYEIAHINFSENWGFYRYIPIIYWSKLLRIKIVLHSHACEFEKFYNRQNQLLKKTIRVTLDLSDCIIVLSKEWEEVFRSISKTRIETIHNFIEVPKENYYNSDAKYITITGNIGKRKGYYDLVNVIPKVISLNKGIKFNFCGNGDIEEIKNKIKKLNVSEYVNLSGWVDISVIKQYLKNTLLYVLPSYDEGMPLGIIEAMGYGIPIISTKVGGIPSLVTDGVNGILIDAGNLLQLEKAIIRLLDDKALRIEMSQNNFDRVKNNFNLQIQMEKVYDTYHSILIESDIKKSKNGTKIL